MKSAYMCLLIAAGLLVGCAGGGETSFSRGDHPANPQAMGMHGGAHADAPGAGCTCCDKSKAHDGKGHGGDHAAASDAADSGKRAAEGKCAMCGGATKGDGGADPADAPAAEPTDPTQPTEPTEPAALDAEAQAAVDQIAQSYLAVQQALAADQMKGVTERLAEVHGAAHDLMRSDAPGIGEKARAVADTLHDEPGDLDEARQVFKSLSAAVIDLMRVAAPGDAAAPSLYLVNCPMADASWLQAGPQIVNPYMGPGMLRCGEVAAALKPGHEG